MSTSDLTGKEAGRKMKGSELIEIRAHYGVGFGDSTMPPECALMAVVWSAECHRQGVRVPWEEIEDMDLGQLESYFAEEPAVPDDLNPDAPGPKEDLPVNGQLTDLQSSVSLLDSVPVTTTS